MMKTLERVGDSVSISDLGITPVPGDHDTHALNHEHYCPACGSPWVDEHGNYAICRRCPYYIPPVTDNEPATDRSFFDFLMAA